MINQNVARVATIDARLEKIERGYNIIAGYGVASDYLPPFVVVKLLERRKKLVLPAGCRKQWCSCCWADFRTNF